MTRKKKETPASVNPFEFKFTGKISVLIDTEDGPIEFHANDFEIVNAILKTFLKFGQPFDVNAYNATTGKKYRKMMDEIT